jgi:hypothetical protein
VVNYSAFSRLTDRLTLAALSWREGWTIRFAHHPLCDRFADHVWRIGRLHLCAGCTCMVVGCVLATCLGIIMGGWSAIGLWPWLGGTALVAAASWPRWYANWRAPMRWLLRTLTGAAMAGPLLAAHSGFLTEAVALVAIFLLARIPFAQMRRALRAASCNGCQHLGQGVCPGFQAHAEAWRRIDVAWAERVMATSSPPDHGVGADTVS